MKRYAAGGTDPSKKKARLDKRAENKMTKAKKTWAEAEASKADAIKSKMPADVVATNQLYSKAGRQEARAKKLKAKAAQMKTGGMVNSNSKVSKQTTPGSKGVKSGVNPKAAASKTAKGRSGGTSKAPKSATPKAQYGMSMRKK